MGERSEHVPRVVYETLKQWKLLNSLQQIKIVANAYGRSQLYNDLERCMVIELGRFDQSANFPPNIRAWSVALKLCSLTPGWIDF